MSNSPHARISFYHLAMNKVSWWRQCVKTRICNFVAWVFWIVPSDDDDDDGFCSSWSTLYMPSMMIWSGAECWLKVNISKIPKFTLKYPSLIYFFLDGRRLIFLETVGISPNKPVIKLDQESPVDWRKKIRNVWPGWYQIQDSTYPGEGESSQKLSLWHFNAIKIRFKEFITF